MAERPVVQTPLDRYVVLEYLAEGGMGAIYLGKKLGAGGFEKEVVLKQLLPEFTRQPEFIDLFLREARLSATLDHANIVHTIDLVCAGDEYFIVMEYVRGGDLRTLLKRAKRRKKRLLPAGALFIGRELLGALAYAHQKVGLDGRPLGLIHRDVSPSNVLVSGTGEVKLTDFGIAKASTHRSIFYKVKGKVGYMSPEQARGEPLDPRSDLYSVAVCIYEMLTGERLFVQAGLTTSAEDLYSQPVPAVSRKRPGLPADLDKVMFKALSVDRDGRYQSAGELQEALLRVSHRHGLMFGAPDLAHHLVDVCGDVGDWGTANVKEPAAAGTEAYSFGQGPGTDKIRLTELGVETGEGDGPPLADDGPFPLRRDPEPEPDPDPEEDRDLEQYLEEEPDSAAEVDGAWARDARPPTARPRRATTDPRPRLTGLELTSIIRADDLTHMGARPLVDLSTPRPPAPAPPEPVEPVAPPPSRAPAPLPAAAPPPGNRMASGKFRATAASPGTDRVPRLSRAWAGARPVVVLAAVALIGIAIAVAIGLSGPTLDPPRAAPAGRPGGGDDRKGPPPRAGASVTLSSEPADARVLIDGVERCKTPCTLEGLSATSPVIVRVDHEGYLPWSALVEPREGGPTRRNAVLRPQPPDPARWGALLIRTDAPAEVVVAGQPIGHVTTVGPLSLPAGPIELTLVAAGGATRRVTATVVAGETTVVTDTPR